MQCCTHDQIHAHSNVYIMIVCTTYLLWDLNLYKMYSSYHNIIFISYIVYITSQLGFFLCMKRQCTKIQIKSFYLLSLTQLVFDSSYMQLTTLGLNYMCNLKFGVKYCKLCYSHTFTFKKTGQPTLQFHVYIYQVTNNYL